MRICVTNMDIAHGVRCSCHNCPVTRAVKRALKIEKVRVTEDAIFIDYLKYHLGRDFPIESAFQLCELPQIARDFIHSFDIGEYPNPITFEISVLVLPWQEPKIA